jgi:hypothetical protein
MVNRLRFFRDLKIAPTFVGISFQFILVIGK